MKRKEIALNHKKARVKTVCKFERNIFALLNDKSRMKEDLHVWFRKKFEVKFCLLTRLRGEKISPLLDLTQYL